MMRVSILIVTSVFFLCTSQHAGTGRDARADTVTVTRY